MKKLIILALLCITACQSTYSYTPTKIKPIPSDKFSPVVIPTIKDAFSSSVKRRPAAMQPASEPKAIIKPVPKPKTLQPTRHSAILGTGLASWYCLSGVSRCTRTHSSGMYAAIRKDLLYLRGKTIKVCAVGSNNCIFVTVIDCNCGPHANIIDLYSTAFRKLAPLSKGAIKVRLYK